MEVSEEFGSDKSLTIYRLEIRMGPEKARTYGRDKNVTPPGNRTLAIRPVSDYYTD
jgi:hypothetical protein